ncbi:MAG: hypothetical protein WC942_10675 [Clostridia bacterium]
MSNLEKEAQRRSMMSKTLEFLNPKEKFRRLISDKYRDASDLLKEVDDDSRRAALENSPSIRESIHKARMSFKNREFPQVVYWAWKIIELINVSTARLYELENKRNEIINQFYGTLEPHEREELKRSLSSSPPRNLLFCKAAPDPDLISEAGITEWVKEKFPSMKQMEGSILERIFRNTMGKQKDAAREVLRIAEKAYTSMIDMFNALDGARTDFARYIDIVKRYIKNFEEMKQKLSVLYKAHFEEEAKNIKPTDQFPIDEKEAPSTERTFQVVQPDQQPAQQSVANYISTLQKKAGQAYSNGDFGVAGALFLKISQLYDHVNNEKESIRFLKIAKEIIKK